MLNILVMLEIIKKVYVCGATTDSTPTKMALVLYMIYMLNKHYMQLLKFGNTFHAYVNSKL